MAEANLTRENNMPMGTEEEKEFEKFRDRTVEGMYLTTAEVLKAAILATIDPKAWAIGNAIKGWYKRKEALEKQGDKIMCMCCKKPITGALVVGGFVIMVPVDVGGFDAADPVACLVGSVCGPCDDELESDETRIMEKAMPGGAVLMAPGSERSH